MTNNQVETIFDLYKHFYNNSFNKSNKNDSRLVRSHFSHQMTLKNIYLLVLIIKIHKHVYR